MKIVEIHSRNKEREVMILKYPKPVMRMTELVKLGFPEDYLMRIFRTKGQTIARKINPEKRNSVIIFDTEGLDNWWKLGK